ncbi:unnamed protein product [Darwinula stevensoni]|uniref:Uncharacterized protein n=1 Tax=Darwinula stevensoni TaxID=69355 RepID=A0A7R9AEL5_9CRUS|nr:unnamed protein product [Darwinula stevensoni]CAG0902160.1 unnamed protein product [Darwinula stevensoni]
MVWTTVSLSCLLGTGWMFGFMYMQVTPVFIYLFTIVNASQGILIFVFHCLLNRRLMKAFQTALTRKGWDYRFFRRTREDESKLWTRSSRSNAIRVVSRLETRGSNLASSSSDRALQYLERYQSKPTSTTYRLDERQSFPAPKITVCQAPSFKKSEEEIKSYINYSLSEFTERVGYHLNEITQRCKLDIDWDCYPNGGSVHGHMHMEVDLHSATAVSTFLDERVFAGVRSSGTYRNPCRLLSDTHDTRSTFSFDLHLPAPCHRLRYSVNVKTPNQAFDENSYLWIYFPEDIVDVLVEKEAYNLMQAVGEFGGCLGMFLGISLVSVYESPCRLIELLAARRIGIG